jgi:hypothetical protein
MAKKQMLTTLIEIDSDKPRDVVPGDPLVINETSITWSWVRILGGDVIAKVATTTTFGKLEKVS